MKRLFIQSTENTPEVNFNPEECFFSMNGVSVPENPFKFYDPIVDWMNNEMKIPKLSNLKVVLAVNIKYFSTSSAKFLLKLVALFNDACKKQGSNFEVEWSFHEEDEDMKEAGELIQKLSNANFIYKSI